MDELISGDGEYLRLLDNIKQEIATSRHRAVAAANKELVCMYWRIGRMIDENSEWGSRFIDSLSHDIRLEYPGIKGFSTRNLKYMLKFSREFDFEFVQTVSAQISWSHNIAIMDKVKDPDQRVWYAKGAIAHGWSLAILEHQISTRLFDRQVAADKVTNFDALLPPVDSEMAQQALKDPYIFDFVTVEANAKERELEDEMVKNVTDLLLELGTGFGFMGRQYHLVVSGKDFYIDLLFYNKPLRRYVAVELKATEFKPEYTGQLGFYVSAIDDLLCDEFDNPTIGLLLCKTKDNALAEYSLRSSAAPIGISEYRTADELPEDMRNILPSPQDILDRI